MAEMVLPSVLSWWKDDLCCWLMCFQNNNKTVTPMEVQPELPDRPQH